jgi:RNA polymerase sigma-70 factor, ECF subfamily
VQVVTPLRARVMVIDDQYDKLLLDLARVARAAGAGADAEDLAQEVLLHARPRIGQLRDESKVLPWLRRMVARAAYKRRKETALVGGTASYEFLPHAETTGIDIADAVSRLPQRERFAIRLVYGSGYTQEEAAEIMNVTRGTVATLVWRARHRLAVELADYRDGRT